MDCSDKTSLVLIFSTLSVVVVAAAADEESPLRLADNAEDCRLVVEDVVAVGGAFAAPCGSGPHPANAMVEQGSSASATYSQRIKCATTIAVVVACWTCLGHATKEEHHRRLRPSPYSNNQLSYPTNQETRRLEVFFVLKFLSLSCWLRLR